MNRTLFAKELRANLFVSAIIAAVLAMYIGTIVAMYDPKLGKSLDAMMQSMPELFAAFGMSMQATTLLEFMLNYLYGFLLTIFILVLILVMANKLMVRYLDRGAMAYLLATPNSRTRIACTMIGVPVLELVGGAVDGRRPLHPVLPDADGIAGWRQVRVPEERQPAHAVRLLRPGRRRRVGRRRGYRAGCGGRCAVRRRRRGVRPPRLEHLAGSTRREGAPPRTGASGPTAPPAYSQAKFSVPAPTSKWYFAMPRSTAV